MNFEKASVLKRYRRLSFEFHPDHGGDPEKFKELTKAYGVLQGRFGDILDHGGGESVEMKTVCGRPLSELGKGFSITESARTCDSCDGNGYREYSGHQEGTGEYGKCVACDGTGLVFHPCRKCGGTGRYIHPKSQKDIGECYSCKGTGRLLEKMNRMSNISLAFSGVALGVSLFFLAIQMGWV